MSPALFQLFNFAFIAVGQNIILLLFSSPLYAAYVSLSLSLCTLTSVPLNLPIQVCCMARARNAPEPARPDRCCPFSVPTGRRDDRGPAAMELPDGEVPPHRQ